MNNEMNKLGFRISKYDIISGIIISLIIQQVFSFNHAIVYLLGVVIGITNFLVSIYANKKWFVNNNLLLIVSTIGRLILVSIMIIPFREEASLVVAYAAGFSSHFVSLIYCTINRKGSA
jgi:hypothetical protein